MRDGRGNTDKTTDIVRASARHRSHRFAFSLLAPPGKRLSRDATTGEGRRRMSASGERADILHRSTDVR